MDSLVSDLPPELVGFVLTLALGLLIGFEREESRPSGARDGHFGGVRTFPIIGMGGFLLAAVFPESTLPFAIGLAVLGSLLGVTLFLSGSAGGDIGITTETAALLTFTLGAASARGHHWIAIAAGVVAVMLLQEKQVLEGLATRMPRHELSTLARFLLITGVILPAVPDRAFTSYEINPFKIWLVVVAVSGVSYASYLLQRRIGGDRGLFVSGILGGAYSSTVTTVVLARQSRAVGVRGTAYAGAITAATGVMYARLWVLLALFSPELATRLTWVFWPLAGVGVLVGALLGRHRPAPDEQPATVSGNPLELRSAFLFAAIFLGVLVATRFVAGTFGDAGILVMAGIMGLADVDPFILGLAQSSSHGLGVATIGLAVVTAATANNVMKGVYAVIFGDHRAGWTALAALASLGGLGFVLYAWL
jgi:uncharacterized membrane protein (DUF4010 family)